MDWMPGDSYYTALFFAFYRHPYTEYSIRNVMYHLGPRWSLQIFTNPVSYDFIEMITTGWSEVHITPVQLNQPDSKYGTADILKRFPDFWRLARGEHLFLFDFDTILREPFDVSEFDGYDYVAPLWHADEMTDTRQPVGCGKVSLRRKTAMLEIASSENPDLEQYPTEDVFYAVNLNRRGRSRVAPKDIARRFASQNDIGAEPFALRRAWIGNPAENLDRLLSSIQYSVHRNETT
jgi:hypothetical protein